MKFIFYFSHLFIFATLDITNHIFVKINSKYKEDDFSDSNAVAFSPDECVLKIHFLLM